MPTLKSKRDQHQRNPDLNVNREHAPLSLAHQHQDIARRYCVAASDRDADTATNMATKITNIKMAGASAIGLGDVRQALLAIAV